MGTQRERSYLPVSLEIDEGADKSRAVSERNDDAYSCGADVVRCEVVRCPALDVRVRVWSESGREGRDLP